MRTSRALPFSVSSTITTASAPSGSGAPVAISYAGAARHALARDLPGEDRFDAAQRLRLERAGAEGVVGDHRVAVHRGAIERRDIAGRDRGPRDDAAVRLAERDELGALDRDGGLGDERARVVERNGFADRANGCHGLGVTPQLAHDVTDLGEDQLGHRQPHGMLGPRQREDRRGPDRARQSRGSAWRRRRSRHSSASGRARRSRRAVCRGAPSIAS